MATKEKILQVGAYPPPYGGNSVHIKRLKEVLETNGNLECKVLDIYSSDKKKSVDNVYRIGPPGVFSIIKAIKIILKYKPDVFHVHVSAMGKFLYIGFFLVAFTPRKSNKIITIHSGSFVKKYRNYNYFNRLIAKKLLKKFNMVIAVNIEQKKLLEEEGLSKESIVVLPAYLPPKPESDNELEDILTRLKNTCKKVIITSGSGVPLYGYDKIIDVINNDKDFHPYLGLIICTCNTYDEDYMSILEALINNNNNIIIIRDLTAEKFAFLLKNSDGYIRATDRDGDAVAIRESNYFSVPVLASNVVNRPSYCQLFDLDSRSSLRNGLNNFFKKDMYSSGDNISCSIVSEIFNIYEI